MDKAPGSTRITFVLILINSAIWIAFSLLVRIGALPGIEANDPLGVVMVVLALLAASALIVLGVLTLRRRRWAYVLTVCAFVFLIVLTVADEVGPADLAVLLFEVLTLSLLLKDWRWYLQRDA
jgi:hypothetical protein